MPPIATSELWSAWMTWIGFWIYGATIKLIAITFFVGDLLMTGRLIFVGAFAIYDRLRSKRFSAGGDFAPAVAVLIPAYNEEKVIERTIRAALRSSYQESARHRD